MYSDKAYEFAVEMANEENPPLNEAATADLATGKLKMQS